ncbi:hypothetical protein E2C01_057450 [Portunus trituberculatus]|uniref:Uncharacterized protein n=1 Tax=Portunus trituberculatus TaxID=210409 RepID=A0A5B7GWU1_PORTR|nr:hypothetical protein [Portunus trituberculatus]
MNKETRHVLKGLKNKRKKIGEEINNQINRPKTNTMHTPTITIRHYSILLSASYTTRQQINCIHQHTTHAPDLTNNTLKITDESSRVLSKTS